MSSYFNRFKAELLQDGAFETIEDARTENFEYIERYYNTEHLHWPLDSVSHDEFEKRSSFDTHKQGDSAFTEESILTL